MSDWFQPNFEFWAPNPAMSGSGSFKNKAILLFVGVSGLFKVAGKSSLVSVNTTNLSVGRSFGVFPLK